MISEYGWAATLLIIYEDRNWENIIYLRARQVLLPIFGSYSRSRELFLLFVLIVTFIRVCFIELSLQLHLIDYYYYYEYYPPSPPLNLQCLVCVPAAVIGDNVY